MGSGTKFIHSELKRQKSKSPLVEDKSTTSSSSALSRRTPTKGKRVSSLGTEVGRGYVDSNSADSPDLALNFDSKPSEKYVKFTVDVSAKKKKTQFSGNKTRSCFTRVKREHSNKQHEEGNRIQKLSNFTVEDNVTNLKPKRRNKENDETMKIHKLCNSKEAGDVNLKLECGNKQFKEAVGSKKLINSETKSTKKLGRKRRKKLYEAAMKTQKINNSELINIPANTSPLEGSERSLNSRIDSATKVGHKRRKKLQGAFGIQKLGNSKEEDDVPNLKHRREAVRIKKVDNSTVESTMKLEHKPRKKSLEEEIKIQKLSNLKVIIPEKISSITGLKYSHTLQLDKVQSSVSAMLQLRDAKTSSVSKPVSLFMDEGQPVYLVIQCIRVPKMCNQHFRFCLPHPLIEKSSDVCLFVPDLKKGKYEDHEPTIEHYKELLEKNNITGISQVIPLRQVKVEYDQYELRRRLVSQFDLFLSDGRIAGHILHLIGREVYKKRKLPVPVNMRAKNLKKEFETAVCKTLMMMNANGNKTALKVGHTKQSLVQIAENIIAVAECLSKHYPGGWDNVRSLHIHLQDSPLIPVYMTLKSSNEVEVPIVRPVVPKKAKPVEGELTTFPGTHVTVMPSGEVVVKKVGLTKEDKEMGLSDSDWEEFNSDEEMDAGSGDEIPVASTDEKAKGESQPGSEEEKEPEDTDGGNEHVAEAAEDAYLSEWSKQWNASIKENTKRKQSETNNGEEEPEEKKQKIVKKRREKQKETKEKTKTIRKKKQRNHVTIKAMEKSQPDSKKCKLFKKNKTESVGAHSVPNRESVQKIANKRKKKEHKKTTSTKLTKKSKVQKSK